MFPGPSWLRRPGGEVATGGYRFSYRVGERGEGHHLARQETGQGGKVRGSYSYVDPTGSLVLVNYEASQEGGYTESRRRVLRRERVRRTGGQH